MFVVFALIATVPLVALSYRAVAETRTALAEEVGRSHEDTARAAAAFVGAYVDTARATLSAEAARGNLTSSELRSFQQQNPTFVSVTLSDTFLLAPDTIVVPASNGTLVGRLDLSRLSIQLQGFAHGAGEAIALTDANGALMAHPDPSAIVQHPDWADVAPVREALHVGAGHHEFTDPVTGEASVAGYAPVPRL